MTPAQALPAGQPSPARPQPLRCGDSAPCGPEPECPTPGPGQGAPSIRSIRRTDRPALLLQNEAPARRRAGRTGGRARTGSWSAGPTGGHASPGR
ncbi:Hypothetical predicted protein, partial [Marmota monax]